jgi:hypothetical protein
VRQTTKWMDTPHVSADSFGYHQAIMQKYKRYNLIIFRKRPPFTILFIPDIIISYQDVLKC